MTNENKTVRKPTLGLALIPIVLTLAVLGTQLFYFGDFTPPYSAGDWYCDHIAFGGVSGA